MSKKMIWGLATLIILIGAVGFLFYRQYMEIEQLKKEVAQDDKVLEQHRNQKTPEVADAQRSTGHFHEDGTFHVGDHPDPIETEPPSRDYNPTRIQIPEGITDPEVQKAWERVDYIANNIWEWGGVPADRTVELVDQLMPPPDGFSGSSGHSDLEDTINLLGELSSYQDPRAIEVLATYLCEGRVGGAEMIDALVEMGPPSVPYLIPYMLDMDQNPSLRSHPINILGRIAEKHRDELGGIVDYIIIPRLEAILSEEEPNYHEAKYAREFLPRVK